MKKELVKVGMKVKLIGDKKAVDGLNSYVYEVFGNTEGGSYNLRRNGNNGKKEYLYAINCADFEPYEEPKEENGTYSTSDPLEIAWLKRMCAENKEEREEAESDLREILNLPKEESTTYQVKDLEGNVIKEKVVEDKASGKIEYSNSQPTQKEIVSIITQYAEDHLPITQEFIESFGFKFNSGGFGLETYRKEIKNSDLGTNVELLVFDKSVYTLNSKYGAEFNLIKCTTQSELRFLLTKGRIDCSK